MTFQLLLELLISWMVECFFSIDSIFWFLSIGFFLIFFKFVISVLVNFWIYFFIRHGSGRCKGKMFLYILTPMLLQILLLPGSLLAVKLTCHFFQKTDLPSFLSYTSLHTCWGTARERTGSLTDERPSPPHRKPCSCSVGRCALSSRTPGSCAVGQNSLGPAAGNGGDTRCPCAGTHSGLDLTTYLVWIFFFVESSYVTSINHFV